jgi:hypothetical protein
MAGLVPAIHVLTQQLRFKNWLKTRSFLALAGGSGSA